MSRLKAPDFLDRGVAGRGFAVEVNVARAGEGRFCVPQHAIGMALSGRHCTRFAMETDRPRQVQVRAGDVQIMPADLHHHVRWDSAHFVVVRLAPEIIAGAVADLRESAVPDLVPRIGLRDPMVEQVMTSLSEQLFLSGRVDSLYAESLVTVLAVHLARLAAPPGGAGERALSEPLPRPVLDRVRDYIEANLDQRLTLQELAAVSEMGAYRFARAFRNAMGVPPHRYVMACRIRRAKALLVASDVSITEIAYAVGFSSHSHMTSTFKAVTGMAPSAFRRRA